MAFEYVALDPPRRVVTRGLYTQRFPFFGIRSRPGAAGGDNAPVVTAVRPRAEAAGVRVGDQILAVDGERVPRSPLSSAPLYPLVHRYAAGDRVTLTHKREEETLDVSLRLLDRREAAAQILTNRT
jgi:S1-C subfamily serine protease